MERRPKEDSSGSSVVDLSLSESIKAIAAYNARAPINNEKLMLLFLQSWWSSTYNRPLKDPLLLEYTLEELLYEYYDKSERAIAASEKVEQESDKIETDKEKEALDWAEAEEKRDLEEEARQASPQQEPVNNDPTKDPDNVAWMEKQMQEAKAIYGENFGEDISLDFNE